MSSQENRPAVRIRFLDLLIFAVSLVACLLGAVTLLYIWFGQERLALAMPADGASGDPLVTLAAFAMTFGAMLPAVGLAVARHGRQAPALLGLHRRGGRWLWLLPILAVALGFVADDAILWLTRKVLGEEAEPTVVALMASLATTPLRTLLAVLVIGVLAPLVEELIFRGLVFGYVEGRFGGIAAMIVSTLLFAAAHVEPAHIAVVLPTGLLLGWARMRTGSIWPAIAAHVANNTVATVVAFLFG